MAAFNDGQISYDQLKNAAQIVVSYDATVKDSVINGDKVENRAWVNDSEEISLTARSSIHGCSVPNQVELEQKPSQQQESPDGSCSRCCDRDR